MSRFLIQVIRVILHSAYASWRDNDKEGIMFDWLPSAHPPSVAIASLLVFHLSSD